MTLYIKKQASAYSIIESMHRAVEEGWGKVPYRKKAGNWEYYLDKDYILHVTFYGTEVVTADFMDRIITNIDESYGSVSTKAGVTKTIRALKSLGYTISEKALKENIRFA